MKKVVFFLIIQICVLFAHSQPPKPPGIEERIKRTNELLMSELKLTNAQSTVIEKEFKQFFIQADKLREDNPPPPSDKVKQALEKLMKERDNKVKISLSPDQFKKYLSVVSKLHPPRPGDRSGGGPPPQRQ